MKKYTVWNNFTGVVVGQYRTLWGARRRVRKAARGILNLSGFLEISFTKDVL